MLPLFYLIYHLPFKKNQRLARSAVFDLQVLNHMADVLLQPN